jgi:hypothetical protein
MRKAALTKITTSLTAKIKLTRKLLQTAASSFFTGDNRHSAQPLDRLTALALGYLGLPLLLFLATWLRPVYSVVTLALVALTISSLAHKFHRDWPFALSVRDTWIILAVALAWAAMSGGSHFVYANPDWHVRDAIIGDLTYGAWPPSYGFRDGVHDLLRSAIGFFLPVAAAAKLVGPNWLPTLMFVWTALGTLLFLMLLPLPKGNAPRLMVATVIIIFFSGMDVLGMFLLHGHLPVFPLRIEWWNDFAFRAQFSYSSLTGQLIWAPNHALPMWIATALFYRHWKHPDLLPLLCLLLPTLPLTTPFALPGLAPFLLFALLAVFVTPQAKPKQFPLIAFLVGLLIGGLVVRLQLLDIGSLPVRTAISSTTEVTAVAAADEGAHTLAFTKNYLLFVLMEFVLLGFVLYPLLKHSRGLLLTALGVLATLPLLTLGPSNDLLLRVSTPSLIVLAILCIRGLEDASRRSSRSGGRIAAIAIMLLIGAHTPFNELWRAATWNAWRPDYTKPFLETQKGGLPPHYVGRLNDPVLQAILRPPQPVPNQEMRKQQSR